MGSIFFQQCWCPILTEDHVRNTPLRQTTFCWKDTSHVAGSTAREAHWVCGWRAGDMAMHAQATLKREDGTSFRAIRDTERAMEEDDGTPQGKEVQPLSSYYVSWLLFFWHNLCFTNLKNVPSVLFPHWAEQETVTPSWASLGSSSHRGKGGRTGQSPTALAQL